MSSPQFAHDKLAEDATAAAAAAPSPPPRVENPHAAPAAEAEAASPAMEGPEPAVDEEAPAPAAGGLFAAAPGGGAPGESSSSAEGAPAAAAPEEPDAAAPQRPVDDAEAAEPAEPVVAEEEADSPAGTSAGENNNAGDDGAAFAAAASPHLGPPSLAFHGLSRDEYEALFPLPPEAPRASTTYSWFRDPGRFDLEGIRAAPHFLVEKVEGTLWLDSNADGARGSAVDSTLNAYEFDRGVAGVQVQLASCATDEVVDASVSLPDPGRQVATGAALQRTQVEDAGRYRFEDVDPGRYYVVYKAPRNYRLVGNALPLDRTPPAGGAGEFDCVPRGGEGDGYLPEILAGGDLDHGGYCARSVGCLEVGRKSTLEEGYADLTSSDSALASEGTDLVVALPSKDFLNVGLAEEPWPLGAYQFADAEVTLDFPSALSEEDFAGATPDNFATSDVKSELEAALSAFLIPQSGDFRVQGVAVHGGTIASPHRTGVRGVHGKGHAHAPQIKYAITARGSYDPPPRLQLGEIVQESINADPRGLIRTLGEREGLPPAFAEVTGVEARHLKAQDRWGARAYQDVLGATADEGLPLWAVSLSIVIALAILALTGVLLFRRAFVTRTATRKVADDDEKEVASYLGGEGVVVTPLADGRGFFRRLLSRASSDGSGTNGGGGGVEAYLRRGSGFAASIHAPALDASDQALHGEEARIAEEEARRRRRRERRKARRSVDPGGRDSLEVSRYGPGRIDGGTSDGRLPGIHESATTGASRLTVYESTTTRSSQGIGRSVSTEGSAGQVRSPPQRSTKAPRQSSSSSEEGRGEAEKEQEQEQVDKPRRRKSEKRRRRDRERDGGEGKH